MFGRNKNKGKPPPGEPPAKLVERAFNDLRVHVRLQEQDIAVSEDFHAQLHASMPELVPYGSNQYAAVRAVLDWDHQIPNEYMLLRIYTAYSRHEARLLDTQIRARDQAITSDNVYPEFDLPDYGDLDASETYIAVLRPGSADFEEFRFFSDWRKEVRPPVARAALSAVKQLESYQEAYRTRQNDALGSAVVVGWVPPCLAKSTAWAVEIWLVVEFDGQIGKAKVFMVDSESLVVTREYLTEVHVP
ncbi:hypothetical protein [Enhygromyxa salina]|uniref:hypothetical protein n=1 Tax=Enhygromyxa salina TaxID=215803 RepID=UPI000D08ACB9|nr:hypothetical protein [Enhygromyxa salina]